MLICVCETLSLIVKSYRWFLNLTNFYALFLGLQFETSSFVILERALSTCSCHSFECALLWFRDRLLWKYLDFKGLATDIPISNTERRFRLYDRMAKELDEHGAAFLKHGETSQSLSLSELFTLVDGAVKPVPKVTFLTIYLLQTTKLFPTFMYHDNGTAHLSRLLILLFERMYCT